MLSYSFLAAATIALISGASGHMLLKTPAPYGAATLNNGPLKDDGSDFPCKQRAGVYDAAATKNVMPIGAPQTLSFTGSAVHGGGSCQVSLTKDLKPTKDTKWMVIYSIEGGCPASVAGNLPENANGDGASKFQYSIPDGISVGEYTLAWTWFNKVGNREMYMNCAPVTVTGGKGKRDEEDAQYYNATEEFSSEELFKRDASFPEMFKANLGPVANDCLTVEGQDVVFPNPGASVEKAPTVTAKPSDTMKGNCGGSGAAPAADAPPAAGASGAAPAAAVSGSGSASAPAGAASPSVSIVAIPPTGTSGGSMASAAVSVASASQSIASAAASVVSDAGMAAPATPTGAASSGSGSSANAPVSPAPSAGSSGSGTGASSGSASAGAAPGSMPCSSPGTIMCSPDGMKFGNCDTNKMAVMMPVAEGTKCVGGAIQMGKRSAKFSKFYNGKA